MIFCFSGCGNTALVAQRLASRLGERVVRIDIRTALCFNVMAQRRVIWAFPVYSWGMPLEVRRFMKQVRLEGGEKLEHYMVATCGDDAGLTHSMWRKELQRRGWRGRSAHTVIMPNTYVSLPGFDVDSAELAKSKLDAAPEAIDRIAHAIKCRSNVDHVVKGSFAWLKTKVVYPLFMRFLCSPKPFKATDACIGCGACSRSCPMGNVTMINSRPEWSTRCTMCLSCYHHCPTHAVAYGKATCSKGQYTAPDKF